MRFDLFERASQPSLSSRMEWNGWLSRMECSGLETAIFLSCRQRNMNMNGMNLDIISRSLSKSQPLVMNMNTARSFVIH